MSDKKKDGGPAFPVDSTSTTGMSLRDYLAAKAMASLINDDEISIGTAAAIIGIPSSKYEGIAHWPQVCAKRAYALADAMLKARDE